MGGGGYYIRFNTNRLYRSFADGYLKNCSFSIGSGVSSLVPRRPGRLAFTVVVREPTQRSLKVRRRLLLDLVGERVDLEPVQPVKHIRY